MLDLLVLAQVPEISPLENGLPGGKQALLMMNGVMFYSLIFTLVGVVLSAGMWAVGAFSSNYTQSVNGKKGFLIAAAAALVIGGANQLLDWFYNTGKSIDDRGTAAAGAPVVSGGGAGPGGLR